jgi:uncharacterized membrane protein HdeD (DUF308 family)
MVTGIILIIVGVAAVVACRAYVQEPVFRNVGIVLGIVVGLLGVYLFLTALTSRSHDTDSDVDLDGLPPIVQLV